MLVDCLFRYVENLYLLYSAANGVQCTSSQINPHFNMTLQFNDSSPLYVPFDLLLFWACRDLPETRLSAELRNISFIKLYNLIENRSWIFMHSFGQICFVINILHNSKTLISNSRSLPLPGYSNIRLRCCLWS
jgi:hypothetical protein